MRCTVRFVCAAWLVAASACSDDGLSVQNLNSSSTAGEAGGDSSGPLTSADGASASGEGDTSGSGGTAGTADPDSASTSETGLEDATSGTTGPASGTSDGSGTTDASGTSEGTTDGSGTSEGSTTGEPCQPITEDPSAIGVACLSDLDCPAEYTCQPFEGFVFQQTCQILCAMACECPAGLGCLETADKSGAVWYQCG